MLIVSKNFSNPRLGAFWRCSSESQYSHNEIPIWQSKQLGVGVEERRERNVKVSFFTASAGNELVSIFAVILYSAASGKAEGFLANRIRILHAYLFT